MSWSKPARLCITKRFEETLERIKTEHLGDRRWARAREKFEERLVRVVEALLNDPFAHPMEPLPRGMDLKEWQLRKIRFDIPGMNWTDRKFRVLYFYNPQTHTVVLARAYTHAEFEGRPSDEEIRAAYDEARLASSS